MANSCNNEVSISGDEGQLEGLLKRIMEQDPKLLSTVPYFTAGDSYGIPDVEAISYDGPSIDFYLSSKWNPPLDNIATLSIEYPELEFTIVYNEPAMELFGKAVILNGAFDNTEYEELEFLETYNEDYIYELNSMTSLSYEEFLKKYTHDNFFDEYPYQYIDRKVLERIKDEDLPKFINREWNDDEAKEEYKRRLSGGSK